MTAGPAARACFTLKRRGSLQQRREARRPLGFAWARIRPLVRSSMCGWSSRTARCGRWNRVLGQRFSAGRTSISPKCRCGDDGRHRVIDELDRLARGSASTRAFAERVGRCRRSSRGHRKCDPCVWRAGHQPVVLKVSRNHGDEWQSGDVLTAFQGKGIVRLLDHVGGAVLLERLSPGDSLATMAINGDDDRATRVLAEVVGRVLPGPPPSACPSVEDWGLAFASYEASGDRQIPQALLETARHVYGQLCASQSTRRLLHGDLHHYNVLLDSSRGWLAIDPKGVIGEPEYEIGAALRNPYRAARPVHSAGDDTTQGGPLRTRSAAGWGTDPGLGLRAGRARGCLGGRGRRACRHVERVARSRRQRSSDAEGRGLTPHEVCVFDSSAHRRAHARDILPAGTRHGASLWSGLGR